MKKLLLTWLLIPTLLFADAVIFSGNDVKALKKNLDLNGVAKILTIAVDPTVTSTTAPIGSIAMNTSTGVLYLKTGAGGTNWTRNLVGPVNLTSDVTGVLPILNGGTGSSTQNFVDLTTNQTVAGEKTFSNDMIVATDITLSAAQFNNVKLGNMASRLVSTGVAGGAILSIDTDTTKFDLTIQYLSFSNYVTTAQDPIVKEVDCPALDAQSVTNLAVADITYILVDDACAVTQQTTYPTAQEQRLKAFIGRLNHTSRTAIDSIFSTPTFIVAPLSQYNDLLDSLGPFNVNGNVVSANGANLSINRDSGTLFRRGLNYATDDQNPHEKFYAAATAGSFFRSTQTAVGTSTFTTLSVSNYDLAGTVTAMPGGGGTATNQRVFLLASGNMAVQYGQVIYSSLANAVSGLPNEAFVINPTLADAGVLIGVISCRKDATAANNTAQCVFSKVSRFDSSGVSVGSNSVATLQSAYDNSVTPQITTSTSLGSLDIIRGSASDTDNVLRIQNGSASDVIKAAGTGRLDTRFSSPTNLLNNGDVEFTDITPITCTTGTCTRTTTSGEFSQGTAALKVVPAANVLDASWIATTPLGIQKQGFARVIYKVPSTCSTTFVVRTMVDGATQTEVPTSKLIMDNTFRSIEVPLTFGSASAGIKVYANGTCTGDTFFDGAILAQGLGLQNLQLDDVYTAKVTTTSGAVTNTNKTGWVTCSAANPTVCTIASGINTQAMNCSATLARSGAQYTQIVNTYSTGVSTFEIFTYEAAGGAVANVPVQLICQKSGNDYLASSANVYSQASGNYPFRSCGLTTSDFTGFGTVSNISMQCSRQGEELVIKGSFTSGTSTGVEARMNLSPGGTLIASGSIGTLESAQGFWMRNAAAAAHGSTMLMEPSVSYVTFGNGDGFSGTATSGMGKMLASSYVSSGNTVYLSARVPISGWTNSSQIVGSFQGYNSTPGLINPKIYSATVSSTGVVTNEKGDWISGNYVVTSTSTYTATYNSNLVSQPMNCTATPQTSARAASVPTSSTTSNVVVIVNSTSSAATADSFFVICHGE